METAVGCPCGDSCSFGTVEADADGRGLSCLNLAGLGQIHPPHALERKATDGEGADHVLIVPGGQAVRPGGH